MRFFSDGWRAVSIAVCSCHTVFIVATVYLCLANKIYQSKTWHHQLVVLVAPWTSLLQTGLSRKQSFSVTTRLKSVHCGYSAIVQDCSCVLSLDLPRAASWYGLGGLYDCSGNCALSRRWRIGMSYSCMDIDRPRTGWDTYSIGTDDTGTTEHSTADVLHWLLQYTALIHLQHNSFECRQTLQITVENVKKR